MGEKKRNGSKEKPKAKSQATDTAKEALLLHTEFEKIRKQIQRLRVLSERNEERLEDIEIHVNLLTRFLTTLCIEKFGMRVGVLKRLIKRIEKDAIRESQITHLESLYKLPHRPNKKGPPHHPRSKDDPWDKIS